MDDREPGPAAEAGRALLGATYLGGGLVHLYLWLRTPGVYAEMTPFVLFDWYRSLWTTLVLPNLGVLLPALAAFEFILGASVLSRGRRARAGNGLGIAFQVALAPLGFWWPANAFLAFGHALLARYDFGESTASIARRRLVRNGTRSS